MLIDEWQFEIINDWSKDGAVVYLDDMLPRVDLAGRGVGPVEQCLCLGVLVGVIIDRSQCQTRFESVPEVFQISHHAV